MVFLFICDQVLIRHPYRHHKRPTDQGSGSHVVLRSPTSPLLPSPPLGGKSHPHSRLVIAGRLQGLENKKR